MLRSVTEMPWPVPLSEAGESNGAASPACPKEPVYLMSLQPNKILGAVLAVAVVVFAIDFVSGQVFDKAPPAVPGYVVDMSAAPVAVAAATPAAGGAQTAAPAPAGASVAPIAERLASADAAAGEKSAKVCMACHSFASDGANKVGPGLFEVVNRKPGSHPGFKYSDAMAAFGEAHSWDYETLDVYLTNPKAEVPGNKMAFAGLKKPEDRANVIAYLRSLSANPAPLP